MCRSRSSRKIAVTRSARAAGASFRAHWCQNSGRALAPGASAGTRQLRGAFTDAAARLAAQQSLAQAWEAKYGSVWHFDVADGMFRHADGGGAAVFRVEASKVMAFAKDPHGQTTYRF